MPGIWPGGIDATHGICPGGIWGIGIWGIGIWGIGI